MSRDWTDGYVSSIDYTFGYFSELNPLKIQLAFLNAGYQYPLIGNACELGFGQGVSTNIHASASTVAWYGNDFSASQAGFAQELAVLSGNNAKLVDEAFKEYCSRKDLPDFDYICLHGIWSWISEENRTIIVDFISRKLKVGGVLYISYNTQPGWTALMPLRDLLSEYTQVFGVPGNGIVKRINDALDFTEKFFAIGPHYIKQNPEVLKRFYKLKDENRQYLAHEYFNQNWAPMPFAKTASLLAPAKLDYVCSANYLEHIDVFNFTPEQQAFLKEIPDPYFRQSLRDLILNTRFRKDYWVKGGRQLTALDKVEKVRNHRVVLIKNSEIITLTFQGMVGEISLNKVLYAAILDTLKGHQPKTIGQIEKELSDEKINLSQILQSLVVLIGFDAVASAQDNTVIQKSKAAADKLNHTIMQLSRSSNNVSYLASAVCGSGIPVNRIQQLFLISFLTGKKDPHQLAEYAHSLLLMQGQKIIKDGIEVQSDKETLEELIAQAVSFAHRDIPILKQLQII